MALTSHLLSFLAASASSADRHHPRRKLRLDFLDRDAVLVLIKLGQTLPYCRDELQFLCYIIDRSVIRHTAQQRLNDLFVRASHLVRHRYKSGRAIFVFQLWHIRAGQEFLFQCARNERFQ